MELLVLTLVNEISVFITNRTIPLMQKLDHKLPLISG